MQLAPKFIAFKGPSQHRQVLAQGLITFEPADYVEIFKERGVTSVVKPRARNLDTYEPISMIVGWRLVV